MLLCSANESPAVPEYEPTSSRYSVSAHVTVDIYMFKLSPEASDFWFWVRIHASALPERRLFLTG